MAKPAAMDQAVNWRRNFQLENAKRFSLLRLSRAVPTIYARSNKNPQIHPPWRLAHSAKIGIRIQSERASPFWIPVNSQPSSKARMKKEKICGRGLQIGAAVSAARTTTNALTNWF